MAFAARERTKPDKERQDAERDRLEAALEAGLEGTFPASDAVVRPFCAEPMRMWPISTRVNNPETDGSFDCGAVVCCLADSKLTR